MALEITYWTGNTDKPAPESALSTETRTLSGSSAQSGATPEGAVWVSIAATEAARFAYGANPTATATAGASGHYIALGERLWMRAKIGAKIAGIQAS